MTNNRPKVGVAVIVIKDKKVLLGKRKNVPIGKGTWGFPGGHLEENESFEAGAKREVMEEAGMKIKNLRFVGTTNDIFKKEKMHYITLFLTAEHLSGSPKVIEPDKCEKWSWFEWKKLPSPLFLPVKNLLLFPLFLNAVESNAVAAKK